MCVGVSVCLSVCLFTSEVPFKRLFAPKVRCPKLLEIQNSIKGCKVAAQKKFVLGKFRLTEQDFFGIGFSHSV